MHDLNPPGIHREAEQSLDEIAEDIRRDYSDGCRSTEEGVASFFRVGKKLLKAKTKIPHGQWLAWVEENTPFGERKARRYMALSNSDAASDLDESWAIICGHREQLNLSTPTQGTDEAEEVPSPTPPPELCSKCEQHGYRPGCSICEYLNRPARGERRPPPVPEIIEEVAPEAGSYAWKPFSWAQVNASLGCILEQLHALAQEHDRADDPQYAEIKDAAVAFKDAISAFHKTVKGKK